MRARKRVEILATLLKGPGKHFELGLAHFDVVFHRKKLKPQKIQSRYYSEWYLGQPLNEMAKKKIKRVERWFDNFVESRHSDSFLHFTYRLFTFHIDFNGLRGARC